MNKFYKVTLGHAVGSENGTHYGKKGNQTGDELRFQVWYDRAKGWHTVLRCKTKSKRKLIADGVIKAVRNKNIGYSQDETRYTLWNYSKPYGYDPSKLTKPCNCDCSSLQANCVAYAGITNFQIVDFYTGNMVSRLSNSKEFKIYQSNKYTQNYDALEVGDIIVGNGHTACVVNTIYWLKSSLSQKKATVDRVSDVKAVQSRLNELGKYNLTIDGDWGIKTNNAVIDFQRSKKLEADGIIGKSTAEALGFLFG